ncbi:hypothetical protein LX32DRAFT_317953 [Colletotrichum zoysiae]|uniref:Uncharacterized protein n=1 Tax=Colletotrichum zoysiae TaxID=1216348 RepID=A0AAD9M6E9_9PEZI|nr:hypothetical protein LX32DRAFT_317953 [Colletotrichum zoysiae]
MAPAYLMEGRWRRGPGSGAEQLLLREFSSLAASNHGAKSTRVAALWCLTDRRADWRLETRVGDSSFPQDTAREVARITAGRPACSMQLESCNIAAGCGQGAAMVGELNTDLTPQEETSPY